jgi:succinate dehydrogenase hydrophobic membrane anchor protein
MSDRYSRSGRPRPSGSRSDLRAWYAVRITALALFVLSLAHFAMTHFVYDPAQETSEFIAQVRWNSLLMRLLDWSMLVAVLTHAFLGMRTVVQDYAPVRVRRPALGGLYLLAATLLLLGSHVVLTLPGR